jgi:hypothetical protein
VPCLHTRLLEPVKGADCGGGLGVMGRNRAMIPSDLAAVSMSYTMNGIATCFSDQIRTTNARLGGGDGLGFGALGSRFMKRAMVNRPAGLYKRSTSTLHGDGGRATRSPLLPCMH